MFGNLFNHWFSGSSEIPERPFLRRGRPPLKGYWSSNRPFRHEAGHREGCWCEGAGYETFIEVKIDIRTGTALSNADAIIELCPCQWRTVSP